VEILRLVLDVEPLPDEGLGPGDLQVRSGRGSNKPPRSTNGSAKNQQKKLRGGDAPCSSCCSPPSSSSHGTPAASPPKQQHKNPTGVRPRRRLSLYKEGAGGRARKPQISDQFGSAQKWNPGFLAGDPPPNLGGKVGAAKATPPPISPGITH
jgi:hypothetical protein